LPTARRLSRNLPSLPLSMQIDKHTAMNRVIVIGCSGSGKSTLARILGAKTGLPIHHLDALYWRSGWTPHPDEAAFQARVREISAQEQWIIDGGFTTGNAQERFSRADTVVLFDLPRLLCLWRVFKRFVTYVGKPRPDLPPGCPEQVDLKFYRYIWNYRNTKFPQILGYVDAHFKGRLILINSERDQTGFLGSIGLKQ
jgi:adenylate kinase family enzyme